MDFINDEEKMKDFYKLSKDEFLKSYSYLSEKDYDETRKIIDSRITKLSVLKDLKQGIEHNVFCYSSDYLMTKPKERYVNQWKDENKKLQLVEEMIKDEKQKLKEKNKDKSL